MKIIVDAKADGLVSLLGEKVVLFCANYFYTGKLMGVNKVTVKLEDAEIIYETGPFSDSKWKDSQSMNMPEVFVRIPMIEAFAKSPKK